MKGLILVILIFIICAVIGFQIPRILGPRHPEDPTSQVVPTSSSQVQQHTLIVVHVDRLDSQQPKLMSVWFVSLFFVDGSPPVLTIAPIYPAHSTARSKAIENAFSLTNKGLPSPGFSKAIDALRFKWEAFLVVDDSTVQRVMEWTNGPGNYPELLENALNDPAESQQVLTQTCQSVGGIANRGEAPFEWNEVVPNHFHSNLAMELALTYWNNLTTSVLPVDCEILLK